MLRGIIFSFCLIIPPGVTYSADLVDICLSIDNSLVDETSTEQVHNLLVSEFDEVCKLKANRKERYEKSSGKTKGSFFEVVSGSASGNYEMSLNESQIDYVCEIGRSNYKSFLDRKEYSRRGGLVAEYISECAKIVADSKQDAILGRIRVAANDEGFSVRITQVQSGTPVKYVLKSIPEGYDCRTGKGWRMNAIGNAELFGNSETAFFCEKTAGEPAQGNLVFAADSEGVEITRTVEFFAESRDIEDEINLRVLQGVNEIRSEFDGKISDLKNELFESTDQRFGKLRLACKDYHENPSGKTLGCGRKDEVLVGCVLGNDQGSYSLARGQSPQQCQDQDSAAGWITAVCCRIVSN